MQTRALLAPGLIGYQTKTTSFIPDGIFDIPGLLESHLYHPLSLALLALIDLHHYCNRIHSQYRPSLADVDSKTGFLGRWTVHKKRNRTIRYEHMHNAAIDIARITAMCTNIDKIIVTAASLAAIFDLQHEYHFAPLNIPAYICPERVMDRHRRIATSCQGASIIKSYLDLTSLNTDESKNEQKPRAISL
ncbi:uncharacterized protein PG986_013035 [Apiospora aurea]|uniref:Uncharacterized protein n=1 Tax=Apiospora aurea TaxID=335848 RepID=A0ABR1Q1P7_9PEZI